MGKRTIKIFLTLLLAVSMCLGIRTVSEAKAKPKLSKTNITLTVGSKKKLKVKGAAGKKVKWSVKKKSIATVSKKGVVKAKKPGKTVVIAKVGKKKLRCKITVKKKSKIYLQNVRRIDSGKAKSSAQDRPGDNYDKGGYDYFGNWYRYAYRFDGSTEDWAIYNLGKKYSKFKGIITAGRQTAPDTRYTGSGAIINVYVYGDGKLLYSYEGLTLTTPPIHFSINVSNVSTLHIFATNTGAYYCGWMYFCNSYFTIKP